MPILKLYYSFLTYLILILVAKLEKISNFALEKKKMLEGVKF